MTNERDRRKKNCKPEKLYYLFILSSSFLGIVQVVNPPITSKHTNPHFGFSVLWPQSLPSLWGFVGYLNDLGLDSWNVAAMTIGKEDFILRLKGQWSLDSN